MPRRDTRERLTAAAKEMIYRQGFRTTTLEDIATAAQVPLGNVYYHFRTKDAIGEAVIEAHLRDLEASFAEWERERDPRRRLKAMLRSTDATRDVILQYGCPYGTLCQELEKGDDPLASVATRLLRRYLEWVEAQIRLLGQGDRAADLAVELLAAQQGTLLLAHTLRSPELLQRQTERIAAWIDGL